MKRIAIFNQNRNFFGTQILQIPFYQFLAEAYPDAERIIFTSNPLSRMFTELDLVHEVVEMKGYRDTASRLKRFRPDLIFCFRRHSDLLNLLIGLHRKTCTVGFASGITRKLFSHTVEKDIEKYRALHYLELLNPLYINTQKYHDRFLALADSGIEKKTLDEKWIFILPGAGKPFKLWGLDNFFALIEELTKKIPGTRFRFVLGPGEMDLKQQIENGSNPQCTSEFNRSIPELVGLLHQADLVIAHDCGPSHISHLCGSPHLGLLSNEKGDVEEVLAEWFLTRPNARVLAGQAGQPISSLTVENVRDTTLDMLSSG